LTTGSICGIISDKEYPHIKFILHQEGKMPKNDIMVTLAQAVMAGDQTAARKAAEEAMAAGLDPLEAVRQGVMKATEVVGERFQSFEIFLPELILAADAAKAAMAVLMPRITEEQRAQAISGKIVIGTVSGDLHDIGKNLVGAVLAANGFEVHDVGIDAPTRRFIEKAEEVGADIIALSCLLSTSLPYQKDVIEYLTDSSRRDRYYVIVGGGPVTPEWAGRVGADGYGRDASEAAEVCKRLMTESLQPPLPQPVVLQR
jgi:corrinoid protein of di/trimethylamine methyltransferase